MTEILVIHFSKYLSLCTEVVFINLLHIISEYNKHECKYTNTKWREISRTIGP